MAFTQGLCQKLQADLNSVAGINAPALKRDRVGYLDALMSDENRSGFEAIPIPSNGKNRSVQVNYIQRGTASSVNLTCTASCDTDQEISPLETIVTITDCIETKGMLFSEDQMRKLCEADSVYVSNVIMAQMNAINTALNNQLLADQATNFGKFADGTTQKDIQLFAAANNHWRRQL